MPDQRAAALSLLADLAEVELPTLGHFLESGFCDPGIRPVAPKTRLAGIAFTVRLERPDALAVNRALLALPERGVLVIEVVGARHAPVGAVTSAAARARGAAGIVVDGPVTDVAVLASPGQLPVYSRGFSCLTTKRLGGAGSSIGGQAAIGGVLVSTGDLVLGDENGLVIIDPARFDRDVIGRARASDLDEPRLLRRIRNGAPLESLLAVG